MKPLQLPPNWTTSPNVMARLTSMVGPTTVMLRMAALRGSQAVDARVSGLLLLLEDHLYFATAAHCMEELAALARDCRPDSISTRLHVGEPVRGVPAVPIDLKAAYGQHPSSASVDVALVPLVGNARDLALATPGVRPIKEADFIGCEVEKGMVLVVCGYPAEAATHETREMDGATVVSGVVPLLVVPAEAHPATKRDNHSESFWAQDHCLFHQLLDMRVGEKRWVENLAGMSGGPVFALHVEGDVMRFTLVGIQSAWLPDSRIIRIEPTRALLVTHLFMTGQLDLEQEI